MATLPATFNDLKGHFCCLKPFHLTYFGDGACIIYAMFIDEYEIY